MTAIITIWHNNVGRPIPCPGLPDGYASRSGESPWSPDDPQTVDRFVDTIQRYGAAILTDSRHRRATNHYVIGVGAGHDDAEWAESRFLDGSHAAWLENSKGERIDSATYNGRPLYPKEIAGLRYLPEGSARWDW